MKNLIIYSILFYILCFVACSKNESQYSSLLDKAWEILEEYPDSISYLLSDIKDPNKLSPAAKADYGYLITRSHQKMRKAMTEDSLILYTLDYYKINNIKDKLTRTYSLAAYYYRWNDNIPGFREMMEEGIEFGIQNGDSTSVSTMYFMLGDQDADEGNYLQAIEHCHKALQSSPMYDPTYIYYIGLFYSRINQIDSADHYFQKSIELYRQQESFGELSFARRNYADWINRFGRYRESLSLLFDNMKEFNDTDHISIAQNYIGLGDLDSAQYYLDQLSASGVELYQTAANLLMATEAVVDYGKNKIIKWSKLGQYNDSLFFAGIHDRKLFEEKVMMKNSLEQQNLLLTIYNQRIQLYLTWGILLIIIITGIVILYVLHKKKLLAEAQENQEILEKMLKEITDKNDETSGFVKKIVLQQLGFIRIVASTPTPQNQQLLKQVSLIDNHSKNVDHILVWDDFYKFIDSVYDNFYEHIASKYDNIISEKELQLCCLLRAGFSTKEISVLTGQKFQTIYQRKTVIRQKLNMDEKEDIIEFVTS